MDHLCVLYGRNYSEPAELQYSSKPPDAQIITVSDWSTHVLGRLHSGATSQEYDGIWVPRTTNRGDVDNDRPS
jgi:hypothetical protein